ncbi:hypothetical protein NDQ71_08710 [Pseudoalteromonas sp. KG3]|uniref:hypothetical protein n=1 Tax=Pseudoalteromonas TaxID=53246 RepID=UPI002657BCAB|nr:hypothetical protein [Pseudoalteromonas sp. KG3]WKD25122.1 hypothetical protein NDQ71_08710 [Pseudoalteromonas sp. KG3]
MFINDTIGPYIGVFIEWGFLMTFLFNLVSRLNNPDKAVVQLSFLMAFSYMVSDFYRLSYSNYLNWLIYDLLTIAVIFVWFIYCKRQRFTALYYILLGLILNALLMLVTHYDIYILHNLEPWWLWTVYSYGVNIVDLLMIFALVTEKDFLFLRIALNKVNKPYLHERHEVE